MSSTTTLSAKEQALIGIGAAVAAGCQSCTSRFIQSARAAGACERGIRLAVETGLAAQKRAAEAMASWAEGEQGQQPTLDASFRNEKQKLVALISTAATYAVNSTARLDSEIQQAQLLEWSDLDIAQAITVGYTVNKTAAEKTNGVAAQLGRSKVRPSNSCCTEEDTGKPAAASTQAGCGCAGN